MSEFVPGQLLHLVFGGELKSTDKVEFKDLSKLDVVGIYPTTRPPTTPGAPRPTPVWITPTCGILSSIFTA